MGECFVQKSDDFKYFKFLNSKFRYGCFSVNFAKFLEHSSLVNYLQEHILSMNQSECILS